MCDRLLVIAKGKIVAEDTPEALEAKYAPMSFEEIFLELTGEMSEEQAQAIADGAALKGGTSIAEAAENTLISENASLSENASASDDSSENENGSADEKVSASDKEKEVSEDESDISEGI